MDKILEAIQKGIQMGLEIQDDELDQSIFQGSQITSSYHVDRADQIKWLRDNFVDLGLPSGNLWCKWNIGATCGKTSKSWYGNYYAWGELYPKETYATETYKYWDDVSKSLTKYNDNDNRSTLDPEDDVVTVTMGKDFRMPTKEDVEELCSLSNEWIKGYSGVRGLNGIIFTGNNGNKLFIPAAGYHNGSKLYHPGYRCDLWSSSLAPDHHHQAYIAYSTQWGVCPDGCGGRCGGSSVRGILKRQINN